jgi:ribosome-associated protein
VVLDVGEVLAIVDHFVITSGSNARLVQTLADEVDAALKAVGGGPLRVEGYDDASWILLDFGDVVVHVFLDEVRAYYELERLWRDVPRLEWEPAAEAAGAGGDRR